MSGVKKKGGRPNRGGGKFHGGGGGGGGGGGRGSGRGGRGRGRGRGSVSKLPAGPGFSRKGGARASAEGYDCDAVLSPFEKEDYSSYHEAPRRPPKRKVTMQKVHMSTENQEMVRGMLQDLHCDEPSQSYNNDSDNEETYDVLDWRAEDQYWLSDTKLVVEDSTVASTHVVFPDTFSTDHTNTSDEFRDTEPQASANIKSINMRINQIAVNKLQRYGFDKSRCISSLEECDGDFGKSLELLFSNCFATQLNIVDKCEASIEEIREQREEEMMALKSIYENCLVEKIVNQVWCLTLNLPYLPALTRKEYLREKPKRAERGWDDEYDTRDICRFYLSKSGCRFGRNCRYKHQAVDNCGTQKADSDHLQVSDASYQLEIRFPEGNQYPFQTPLVAFYSSDSFLSNHSHLHITSRLMNEAAALAVDRMPAIFSLMSIMENEDEITELIRKSPLPYSLPPPVISRHMAAKALDLNTDDIKLRNIVPCKANNDVERCPPEYVEEDDAEANTGDQVEKMRMKYGRKDILQKRNNAHNVQGVNRKLKDRFRNKQNHAGYKSMKIHRKKLPAWEKQRDILDALKASQVLVVSGMTGCGKTTQVPQFILDNSLENDDSVSNIICTQPRRISAISVAERVSEERAEKLGGCVGYQIRLESVMSADTRMLFCTTGILLRRLEGDPTLKGVSHIIIDEVHERSEESDFLMMIARDLLLQRSDLRIILMSATLNAELFSYYFGGCPVVDIPGRTFHVDQYFLEDVIEVTQFTMEERSPFSRPLKSSNAVRKDTKGGTRPMIEDIEEDLAIASRQSVPPARDSMQDQNLSVKQLFVRYADYRKSTIKAMAIMDHDKINIDLIESAIEWIVEGEHEYPKGAVLVFMPGLAEITSLYERLQNNHVVGNRNKHRYSLIPLHSSLSSEEQHAVFRRPKEGVTKIVISTNIAETSITIDDVVFVIDAGRMKEKRYDSSKGMESLEMAWVSRANAMQRKGRAGRVASGVCLHLYTNHRFQYHLRDQPVPEIQRVPLEQLILKIKMLPLFKEKVVEEVLGHLIEPPSRESIETSLKRLIDLGALDVEKKLTPLGYHLGSLPVDVRIGKLMLFGAIFRCLDPALTIAASLTSKSPFVAPFDKREDADNKKREFAVGNSDHLTMLSAYKGWISAMKYGNYAGYNYTQENFLSIKTLQMLASMKRQFTELLSDIGFVKEGLTIRDIERLAKGGSDGVLESTGADANCNSDNLKLVAAILVAALYPNVVQVMTPESKYSQSSAGAVPLAPKAAEIKFKTKTDGYVFIHPSSINFQVRYYESPYLVFHEKMKTSKVFIRDCTMVSVYPLLLFGGGSVSIDLDRGNFVMSVDEGWIRFMAASHQVAELVKELRLELDQLLQDKIENPGMDLCSCPRGSRIINTIVKLISTQ